MFPPETPWMKLDRDRLRLFSLYCFRVPLLQGRHVPDGLYIRLHHRVPHLSAGEVAACLWQRRYGTWTRTSALLLFVNLFHSLTSDSTIFFATTWENSQHNPNSNAGEDLLKNDFLWNIKVLQCCHINFLQRKTFQKSLYSHHTSCVPFSTVVLSSSRVKASAITYVSIVPSPCCKFSFQTKMTVAKVMCSSKICVLLHELLWSQNGCC